MLFVGAAVVIGVLLYRLKIRHQIGMLAEHLAAPQTAPLLVQAGERPLVEPEEETAEPARVG